MGYAIAFLVLLTLAVVCVTAYLFLRLFSPDSLPAALAGGRAGRPTTIAGETALPSATPTPGRATVTVDPGRGTFGTLVSVSGEGWQPGEPVFVFLRSPDEPNGQGYSYAAAVADDTGRFRTAFTFPYESRWIGRSGADLIARGTRSGLEATARFVLEVPTPTRTLEPTMRPTALPTHTSTLTPTPTLTPSPTATPTPIVVITEWRGEYFANANLAGPPLLVRNDRGVDFDWGTGSPGEGLPSDGFSARWTRRLAFQPAAYRFTVAADDGVRFWVDGRLYVDEWHDSSYSAYSFEVSLAQGDHWLILEYYENLGNARVFLGWERIVPPTDTPLPTDTPTPTVTPTATPTPPTVPWDGAYYANPDLEGEPQMVRQDGAIDFDWGSGSPDAAIPVDGFSVRWQRALRLAEGIYRLTVTVDDGVRLWLDGILLLDQWYPTGGATYWVEVSLVEGTHVFRVEYLEATGDARIQLGMTGPN